MSSLLRRRLASFPIFCSSLSKRTSVFRLHSALRTTKVGTGRYNSLLKTTFVQKSVFGWKLQGQFERNMASSRGNEGDKKANRLLKERSPYLLQHAYNPVDWYPWGEEAFEKARKEDKPIFLSVGYSTCHWCHVMERESFEHPQIAKMLNDNFVPIKVDREERPDVDRVYMNFVQATTGRGGWPMSVWLTPDLQPFIGGTYFQPEDGAGRHGFKTIIAFLAKQWKENRSRLTMQGTFVMDAIKQQLDIIMSAQQKVPEKNCIDDLLSKLSGSFDDKNGGFGGAPRFPQPSNLCFLMNYHSSSPETENGKNALKMTLRILDAMESGGIHDHVGQGFHRYSTDGAWHVPHFEKMLYDQSQLVDTYLSAYQITHNQKYSQTAKDILLYVMRDLSDKSGGFYAAEDADSLAKPESEHKTEGAFCVWEEEEIKTLLSETVNSEVQTTLADIFIKHYGVKTNGNVDPLKDPQGELTKKNVLIVHGSVKGTSKHFELDVEVTKDALSKGREILFEERLTRPKPHLDTKMVTSWNGLMIGAFARAACILKDDVYLKRATKAALFAKKYLWNDKTKKLARSCYQGSDGEVVQLENPVDGFADDYAFLIYGLLELYQASFDESWLEWASVLQERQNELLWDDKAGGYFEGDDQSKLLIRLKQDQDGAEPSGNSIAANNLLRLATFLDKEDYRKKAEMIYALFEPRLTKTPNALPMLIASFILYNDTQKQIIISGERDSNETKQLLESVHSCFIPNKVLILRDDNINVFLPSKLSVLKNMEKVGGKATAYYCENFTCQLPVTSSDELEKILKGNKQ